MLIVKDLIKYKEEIVKKVYSIECISSCEECRTKYNSGCWCPKSYADDFNQGLDLILSSECKLNNIANIIQIEEKNNDK